MLEGYKASLLTSPQTHVVNFLGNSATQVLNLAEQSASAAGRAVTGNPKALRELGARIVGTREGVREGLRLAMESLRSEDRALELQARANETARRPGAIGGKAGRVIRTPFRLLTASDQLFRTMAERQELYARAMREALERDVPATN